MRIMDMVFADKEVMSPEEFLELRRKDAGAIKSSRIIPSRLGSDSFGKIEVTYRFPRFVGE